MKRKYLFLLIFYIFTFFCFAETSASNTNNKKDWIDKINGKKVDDNKQEIILTVKFDNDFLNIYINDEKINFFNDTVGKIIKICGSNYDSNLYSRDRDGNVILYEYLFDGLDVLFNVEEFKFRTIIISSDKYSVELNGRVGLLRDDIEKMYPKGFYFRNDKKCLYYMREDYSQDMGVGYRFYFNEENILETIVLGNWAFAK